MQQRVTVRIFKQEKLIHLNLKQSTTRVFMRLLRKWLFFHSRARSLASVPH